MNKYTIQIPTVQFGLISVEIEGTQEDAISEHNTLLAKYRGETATPGLPIKDWNAWLDKYLTDGTGNADSYGYMNTAQQTTIQEIKKAMKRIKSKTGEREIDIEAENTLSDIGR